MKRRGTSTNGMGRWPDRLARAGAGRGVWCACTAGLVALAAGCAASRPVSRPPPADADLLRLSAAAHRVMMHAGPERAAPLYREALARARALDADSAIRPLAFNLAACLLDAGEPARADALLREALRAAERGGEPEAEIRVLQARVAARTGDPEAARRAMNAARAAAAVERRRDLARAMTLLEAEMATDAGEIEAAQAALRDLDRAMTRRDPDAMRAGVEAVRARVFEAGEQWADAARAWDARAQWLGAAGLARAVPPALERAGRAWEAAGSNEEAAERWYRAARAWLAQGQAAEGAGAMARARGLTESDALRAALSALRGEGETE